MTAVFLLLLTAASLFAQKSTISGVVTSSEDNLPVPGVNILIKGTLIGTITDFDGKFQLELQTPGDILVFSFIGFAKEEVKATPGTAMKIVLNPDMHQLDDVVVTALGIKRQEREIGYSTEKIEAKMVERSSTPNVISALSGRAAGVQIATGDGVDGNSTRITIRGNNNFKGNNQPLIVIDGVQMESTEGLLDVGRGQDWGNALNNVNSMDIESYNVLKGGAASALYGARGANGVIEITTKKGKVQKGIGISYNMTYRIKHPYRYRDVQNKYGAGGPVAFTPPTFPTDTSGLEYYPDSYGTTNLVLNQEGDVSNSQEQFGYYGGAVSWGPEMDGRMVMWWDKVMRPYSPQPDNISMFYHNGYTVTHNVEASGGNEKGTMRFSVTNLDHREIIDNTNYNQTTINLGSQLNVTDKVHIDVAATYVDYHRLNSPIIGESGSSFNKGSLYSWPRSYKGLEMDHYQNIDGTMNRDLMDAADWQYVDKYLWWNIYNHNTTLDRNKFYGSIGLRYDITNWLAFSGRTALDFNLDEFTTKNKPIDAFGIESGYYSSKLQKYPSANHDFMFIASKDKIWGSNFNLELSLGGATRENTNYYLKGSSGDKWYYANYYSLHNYTPYSFHEDGTVATPGSLPEVESVIYRDKVNSIYSYFNIGYKNFMFLQLTGRNDWSSTLDNNNNSYFYPSASLSFVLSEAFHFDTEKFNFWKLRGGAAQTATDANPYETNFYYGTTFFAGQQLSTFSETIPPFELKPQRVNSYEVGTTLGFFKNKIELDFTYYYTYSFDQILTLDVPVSSGSRSLKTNEGAMSNRGVEIILKTVPYNRGDFTVQTGFNFTRNRNIVESLGEYVDEYHLADLWENNGPKMILREGDDYGTISGYGYVYNENGQPIVRNDGTHYLITDDYVPMGNASPKFLAAWDMNVRYKNFNLSALIDAKVGGDIYCGSYVIGLQTGQSPETLVERDGGGLPYTDPEGNTSNIGVVLPGVYADGTPNDKVVHYYYKYLPNAGGWGHYLTNPGIVEDTWIKMREVSLSYNLPQKLAERTKIFQKLVVSVTGRDLFYLYTTVPDRINPEGIMGSSDAQGFEWASYPSSRSIIFGIQAQF